MKPSIIFLLFASGYIIFLSLFTCNKCHRPVSPSHTEEKILLHVEKTEVETALDKASDSLQKLNMLNAQLTFDKSKLLTVREALLKEIADLTLLSKIKINKIANDDSASSDCKEIADRFNDYIDLSEAEKKVCDSIISNLNQELAADASSNTIRQRLIDQLNKSLLGCTDKYDKLFKDYSSPLVQSKKHLQIGLSLSGQYNEGIGSAAIGGGPSIRFKNDLQFQGLVLIPVNGLSVAQGHKIYQLTFTKTISFRRR
jgi:hypothetical protein